MLRIAASLVLLGGLRAQTLEVRPNRIMTDQAATILATGLQAGERVSIRAELTDGDDVKWTSQADFAADSQGMVDTSRQAPAGGSYKEISALGLVWSMKPASHSAERYAPPRDFGAQEIDFHLLRGSQETASANLAQSPLADGVKRIQVHDGALRGTFFVPAAASAASPLPAMLVLGGSEGGLPSRRAAWLASHGYAALALAYFRFDDLPKELADIPLEYFGEALKWLAQRPEVARDRTGPLLGVMGTSRGAELALELASTYRVFRAVVAYSPSDVRKAACCGFTSVPYAWTLGGRPLAFQPVRSPNPALALEARIQVERIRGPVMLISGGDDRVWNSSAMADSIAHHLKSAHFAYEVEHLNYPHAGHGAGRSDITPAWVGEVRNPTSGRAVNPGGTPAGNAGSSIDAIPKVLEFLKTAFFPQP